MLKVVEEEQSVEDIAAEYLEWKEMLKETEKRAKELRAKLLKLVAPLHQASLFEGEVVKLQVGPAIVNFVARFKPLTPAQVAVMTAQLGETVTQTVVDTVTAVSFKDGISMDIIEAVVGETKLAKLAPLLEAKEVSKLNKKTYQTIAALYSSDQTDSADALLGVARLTAYEPHVRS